MRKGELRQDKKPRVVSKAPFAKAEKNGDRVK